jgi:hypothetical protein
MKELVEYFWNEQTETAEFTYEGIDSLGEIKVITEIRPSPLVVEAPKIDLYWSQLICWLRDEGYRQDA